MTRHSTSFVLVSIVAIVALLIVVSAVAFWQREQRMPQIKPFPSFPSQVRPEPTLQPTPIPTVQPSSDPTATWKTYRNEKYGFEVKYPSFFAVESDLSGASLNIGPTSSSGIKMGNPLIIRVIELDQRLPINDIVQRIIKSSKDLGNFQLHHQAKMIFSNKDAYEIFFTGGIYNPINRSYDFFDEPMEAVYVRHDPYLITIFIPKSSQLFSEIALTLTLYDLHGDKP